MKKSLLIAILGFALLPFASEACPLGAKEDHLTIQRVMMNFGKYVGQADHIALLGAKYPNETVTDADIADAVNRLGLAKSCAEAVIANPTGDLLPGKVMFLEGQEREDYIEDFVYFMTEFRDALGEYQTAFQKVASAKAADRNWDELYQESQKINDLIDHAHRKTSGSPKTSLMNVRVARANFAAVAGGSLKQNMKQIEKNLKAIAAAINDVSQNQQSAALAEQAGQLFQATYAQIPEAVSDLPAGRQQEAMAGYQAEIQKGIDLCAQLRDALLGGDNATALQILKALSQLKEEGHDHYNP